MSTPPKPSIVFAHGLWADGSCFSKVIPALQAEGHEVVSTQNSLDTPQGDVAAVRRALGRVSSPAILVGHSYGGTVITAAGTADRVAGLVCIAALAPDESETSQSLQDKPPSQMSPRTSNSRRGVSGCSPTASHASRETCPSRSRRSSGRPRACRTQTCSIRSSTAPPGGRSRAGTSWPTTTVPFTPTWNVSAPSGWAPPPTRPTAATCPCSPTRTW